MGDTVFTTNNPVLLRNTRELPAIMCIQRKAEKKVPTEADLIQSNKNGFGDAIGATTNVITAMIDVQAQYDKDSLEYKALEYRIMCGQLYQQAAIDKIKGIEAKPMPASWYSVRPNFISETDDEETVAKKQFYMSIVADKKPYFMNYRYTSMLADFKKYIKNSNLKTTLDFGLSINELIVKEDKTEEENTFLDYFYRLMPVSANNCVSNQICRKIEGEFDDLLKGSLKDMGFDYSILKSDAEYTQKQFREVAKIYTQYAKDVVEYQKKVSSGKESGETVNMNNRIRIDKFKEKCQSICTNQYVIANIVLDLCYSNDKSKRFAWDLYGDVFIDNLLDTHNYEITYPTKCDSGEIEFNGSKFTMKNIKIEKGEANDTIE